MSTEGDVQKPETFSDPAWVVFAGEPVLRPGEFEAHSFDPLRGMFTRTVREVKEDWAKIVQQIQEILSTAHDIRGAYVLDSVSIELGFSAEGQLVFIAKGGIEATVKVTLKRVEGHVEEPADADNE